MSNPTMWHGDVILESIDAIPEGAVEVPRENGCIVVARGESDNVHVIEAETATMLTLENEFFLRVTDEVVVTHEGPSSHHGRGPIVPGLYKVSGVQEYDHFAEEARRVAD